MSNTNFSNPVKIGADETITKAIGKMLSKNITSAIVEQNGYLNGIVTACLLAKKNISEPEKTKIIKYTEKIKPLAPGTEPEEIARQFLINDYYAVPIMTEKQEIKIITYLDLLKELKSRRRFIDKKAEDIMNFPYCITSQDTIATAKSIMKDLNISRIPVVDNKGMLEGVVDSESLLKTIIPKRRSIKGEAAGEKTKLDKVSVSAFMKKNIPKAKPNTSVNEIINIMLKNNETTVIVEEKGKPAGIITPKDILKILGEQIKGAYVTVSGIQDEDIFIKSLIDNEIEKFVKKISKIYPVNYLVVHVQKHRKTGTRSKYSVHARLSTNKGFFYNKTYDWDLTKAFGISLDTLEREVLKKKEKETF